MKREILFVFAALLLGASGFAQKTKVNYDKGADFAGYKTYVWSEPERPQTRPMLYAVVIGSVDYELKSKGLARTQADGDLIVMPAGGVDFGFNTAGAMPIVPTRTGMPVAIDSTMWTGAAGSSMSVGSYVPEGTLMLTLVESRTSKIVWSGSVALKLDMEKKHDSLKRIEKAIAKLLQEYPPRRK